MRRLRPATHLSIALTLMVLGAVFGADALGLLPEWNAGALAWRVPLARSAALQCALIASGDHPEDAGTLLTALVSQTPSVSGATLRNADGETIVGAPGDEAGAAPLPAKAEESSVIVPIQVGGKPWGTLEIRFAQTQQTAWHRAFRRPLYGIAAFLCVTCFTCFLLVLRRALPLANPAHVVPQRVRTLLDTMTEGVLILDTEARIVFANRSFGEICRRDPDELVGSDAADVQWCDPPSDEPPEFLPWQEALRDGQHRSKIKLGVLGRDGVPYTLEANIALIRGEEDSIRGVLATFDNITIDVIRNAQLESLLESLGASNEHIREQNQELQVLATTDPLTQCKNRRAFFAEAEARWRQMKVSRSSLGCILADIDRFKLINDTHGHAAGDVVLKEVAARLRASVRQSDILCRFGGEEFCILCPNASLHQISELGERLRVAISSEPISGLIVSASFGIGAVELGATDLSTMIEQADQALYGAKESGRNRVVVWSQSVQRAA